MPKRYFSEVYPEKIKYWSHENDVTPDCVTHACDKKIKFDCPECNHEFELSPANIKKGSWCYYCSGKRLCEDGNCSSCYKKSFASSEQSKCLIGKNPLGVYKKSTMKFDFYCEKCKHTTTTTACAVNKTPAWCSFCRGWLFCEKYTLDPNENTCKECYNNSCASFDSHIVDSWSYINLKKPCEVLKNANVGVLHTYDCIKCNHTFKKSNTDVKCGVWCPYCAGIILCDKVLHGCKHCFDRSFASSDKAIYWDFEKNYPVHPDQVTPHSHKKYHFNCECGKLLHLDPRHIYRLQWCTDCDPSNRRKSKSMFIIEDLLKGKNIKYKNETVVICDGRKLRWDFEVFYESGTFHIESDGQQHFEERCMRSLIRNSKSDSVTIFKDQRVRDLLKEEHTRNNGKILFRISYRQVRIIDELLEKMLKMVDNKFNGVYYMDDIYWGDNA